MVLVSHFRKLSDFPTSIETIVNPCGYLGVALFLFLSGYGCSLSKSKNNLSTLGHRIGRILVPLSICTFVSAAFVLPPPIWQDVTLQALALNSKFCPPMWYLTLQILCYALLLVIGNTTSLRKIICACFFSSVIIMVMSLNVDIDGMGGICGD